MQKSFIDRISISGILVSGVVSVTFLVLGYGAWAAGVIVSTCWIFLNIYLMFQLIAMSMDPTLAGKSGETKQGGRRDRVLVFSILKFPVLYIAGFFILKSRVFPVYSILLGLTLFLAVFSFFWFRMNIQTQKKGSSLNSFLCLLFSVLCLLSSKSAYASETTLEPLNFIYLVNHYLADTPLRHFLHRFENIIFTFLIIGILGLVSFLASHKAGLVPGRLQSAFESVVEALDGLVCGILGPEGRKYTPFLGTLFLYIWTMNLIGLVPLMKSPTSSAVTLTLGALRLPIPTVTVALALLVFFYVQWIGLSKQGILGYFDHMAGTPRDVFGFILSPIMLVIHVIGELAKPLSLSFRLYGNIWGEDVLLAVFVGLGIGTLSFLPVPAGLPLQFPFILLAMVTGTIQAFVFTLLSTVYIAMMLPHEHKEEHRKPVHV